jgi:CRP-like cAMP-binding protein
MVARGRLAQCALADRRVAAAGPTVRAVMPQAENILLERLARKDRARLIALAEPIPLVMTEVLCEPGRATRYVYFPTDGFISLVAPIDGKPALEVGMVGREGMLGAQLALGVATVPLHALVQGPGAAWRIGAAAFRGELARSAALQRLLDRYLYVLMAQLAASAACLRFHRIGPRLARWLLMSQDRAQAEHFHVTHEFLAYMLGVRRVGVTAAAGSLQRGGLIDYHRGEVTVRDRGGLEAAACACYASDRRAYAELLE